MRQDVRIHASGDLAKVRLASIQEETNTDSNHRLRNLVWHCVVVQQLVTSMQEKTLNSVPAGTPSKQLAYALATLDVHSPTEKHGKGRAAAPSVPDEMKDVMHQVTKARSYNPGKKITQEVQLVIRPSMFVEQVRTHLRYPDPNVGKLQARKAEEAATIAALHGLDAPGAVAAADRNSKFDDPEEDCKLWVQQSLIEMAYPELIEDWEEHQRLKAEGKLKKGRKPPAKSKGKGKQANRPIDHTRIAAKGKARDTDSEDDLFASSKARKPPVASASRSVISPIHAFRRQRKPSTEGSDSDIELVVGPSKTDGGGRDTRKAAHRSPRKSPRKFEAQTTARRPVTTEVEVPLKANAKELTRKANTEATDRVPLSVLYAPISDSSDDEQLTARPPALSFAIAKSQGSASTTSSAPAGKAAQSLQSDPMLPTLSASSSSSASGAVSGSATPSDGGSSGRIARGGKSVLRRHKTVKQVPTVAQEVIDLCSSD